MDNHPNPVSHSSIIGKLEEKHSKQKIEIVDEFPRLDTVSTNVMLGSFSWYWMNEKHKNILRPFAFQFDKVVTTPSEIARMYLELKYPKQRGTKEQISYFRQKKTAPLYAQPHKTDHGVYIDIKSAYWQILQIVGWDADYNPAKWLGRGVPMDDFPYADIKLSRNCLITAGLPSEASFWQGQQQSFRTIPTFNRSANLGIWTLVMDILHGVAWDCIKAGAFYAHTDGYICDTARLGAVMGAIAEWGLEARIKNTGETEVYGVGSYSIGDKRTHTPRQSHYYDGLFLSSHHNWLKSKVRFFSERTKFIWQSSWKQVRK